MVSGFEMIPRFALRRPVTMLMVLAGVVVLGAVSYFRLPLELMPSGGEWPRIWLQTYYRHASAADILERILDPTEEQLRTLPGLKSIESKASFERGSISLDFHRGTDLTQAYLLVREKLERLRPNLPDDFDRFTAHRWNNRARPFLWARVVPRNGTQEAMETTLERLEQSLGRIPGVAKVDIWGQEGEEVAILLEPGALSALRADPSRVVEALRADNFSLPLGWLMEGERRDLVRATAHPDDLRELAELPLAPERRGMGAASGGGPLTLSGQPSGTIPLKLGDVGRVRLQKKERSSWSKVEGRPAVTLAVYKETDANTVTVGRAVRRAFAEEFPRDPLLGQLDIHPLFAEDEVISEALASLQQTALWGGVFASLVLFAFFRRWLPTLLVMAAVPVSLLFTLVWMFFLGSSINIISMTGLMLALGMLVDNAVVVVENTSRLRAAGVPAYEAARRGTGEVGMAILMGTLTTVIVFLPLPFLGGGAFMTFIFKHLSYPIVLSLLGSLVVAALFVPLIARLLLGGIRLEEPRWLAPIRAGYLGALRLMLHRRLDATLLLLLTLSSVALPISGIKWDLFGSRGMGRIWINFDHSPVFSVADTESYFDRLSERLDPQRQRLGIKVAMVQYRRGGGTLSLFLEDSGREKMGGGQLFDELRKVIGVEPGVSYSLRGASGQSEERNLSVRLFGPQPKLLRELAEQVRRVTQGLPGVGELTYEEERPPREIAVVIDRRQAETLGVTAREAAMRVAAALRGNSALPRFRLGDREIEVVVRQEVPAAGLDALRAIQLWGSAGIVPLEAVARLDFREAPDQFTRTDGQISLTLEGRLEGNDFAAAQKALNGRMARMKFPKGYGWGRGGKALELSEDQTSMGTALLLSVVSIFIVMGVLFESFLLPVTVLATIPLAFLGSAWLVYLTGTAMDSSGMIGLVILAGVVVNNGIVLVDRINRNRWEGMGLEEAILQAGEARLRPILMTALTTIVGILPMVFGFTNVAGYSFVAMGQVVVGGLVAATALTLFVVPLTYRFFAGLERVPGGKAPGKTAGG